MSIGALELTPEFNSEILAYTAATTNATNTITATAPDPTAVVVIDVGGTTIENGSPATWDSGENTVTITVTDSESITKYTVTVTKS